LILHKISFKFVGNKSVKNLTELNLKAIEISTFIPSGKDYEAAIRFYQEIGLLDYKDDNISVLRKDNCRFFSSEYPKQLGSWQFYDDA